MMIGAEMLGLSTNLELLFRSLDLEPAMESLARASGICCFISPGPGPGPPPLDSLVADSRWLLEALVSLSFLMELLVTCEGR